MNRRAFLGTLLGAGAAVTAEAVAPSLVWPFRKYFLPSNWRRWVGFDWGLGEYPDFVNFSTFAKNVGCIDPRTTVKVEGCVQASNNGLWTVLDPSEVVLYDKPITDLRFSEAAVEAIELESFAKQIPDLIYGADPMWKFFKSRKGSHKLVPPRFRIPMQCVPYDPKDQPVADAANKVLEMVNGNRIEWPAHKKLLHQKATVENIVRFVDELQES